MKIFSITLPFIFLLFVEFLSAQAPAIQWEKCYGGSGGEAFYSIRQTTDFGHIIAGATNSIDGDVSSNHGNGDVWVVKTDGVGNIQWQKTFGGSKSESAISIRQTSDKGYIFIGESKSSDGDVTFNYSNLSYNDIWIVKIDSIGKLEWQKSLGGSLEDVGKDVLQTSDGGYVLMGRTNSIDGDLVGRLNQGNDDIWIVKLDASGLIQWKKFIGGSNNDDGNSITHTSDGGYLIAGETASNDGDVSGNHWPGTNDGWIVKLNSVGNILWQKCLGGTYYDSFVSAKETIDGGYMAFGATNSNDGDVIGSHGGNDFWVVKIDSNKNILWQKSIGGSQNEAITKGYQTIDNGAIIIGFTSSIDGDITVSQWGGYDAWVGKLNASGSLQWQKGIGGSSTEIATDIYQADDGGYIIGGYTFSSDGDFSCNHGTADCWIVKLAPYVSVAEIPDNNAFSISPNPVNNLIQIKVNTPSNSFSYFLTDQFGRVIHSGTLSQEFNTIDLNEIKFPSGIYFLRILSKEQDSYVKKVVVIR